MHDFSEGIGGELYVKANEIIKFETLYTEDSFIYVNLTNVLGLKLTLNPP